MQAIEDLKQVETTTDVEAWKLTGDFWPIRTERGYSVYDSRGKYVGELRETAAGFDVYLIPRVARMKPEKRAAAAAKRATMGAYR